MLQEEPSDEMQKVFVTSFRKMSASFADTSKVEESFENLHRMKDNNIFKDLAELSKEDTTFATVRSIRVIPFLVLIDEIFYFVCFT